MFINPVTSINSKGKIKRYFRNDSGKKVSDDEGFRHFLNLAKWYNEQAEEIIDMLDSWIPEEDELRERE